MGTPRLRGVVSRVQSPCGPGAEQGELLHLLQKRAHRTTAERDQEPRKRARPARITSFSSVPFCSNTPGRARREKRLRIIPWAVVRLVLGPFLDPAFLLSSQSDVLLHPVCEVRKRFGQNRCDALWLVSQPRAHRRRALPAPPSSTRAPIMRPAEQQQTLMHTLVLQRLQTSCLVVVVTHPIIMEPQP